MSDNSCLVCREGRTHTHKHTHHSCLPTVPAVHITVYVCLSCQLRQSVRACVSACPVSVLGKALSSTKSGPLRETRHTLAQRQANKQACVQSGEGRPPPKYRKAGIQKARRENTAAAKIIRTPVRLENIHSFCFAFKNNDFISSCPWRFQGQEL